MKKVIIGMSLVTISLMAADYSQMTMEELNAQRGTVAIENRDAFRAEMQSRMQAMTPEERAIFRADRTNIQGQGARGMGTGKMDRGNNTQGTGQRVRDGSGAGKMGQGIK